MAPSVPRSSPTYENRSNDLDMKAHGKTDSVSCMFASALERLRAMRDTKRAHRSVRIWTPSPTVAFSRRDELHHGYSMAASVAVDHGYAPIVRPAGGHFVAMDVGTLVIDEFGYSIGESPRARFVRHTDVLVGVLTSLGFDARVGKLPLEYCPGDYSINHAGAVKLSGTAQRVSGNAWLVTTAIRTHNATAIHAVMQACADALDMRIDPSRTGALDMVAPSLSTEAVAHAVAAAFGRDGAEQV